jgi:transcriptional regulator with XRE-family HTH domain
MQLTDCPVRNQLNLAEWRASRGLSRAELAKLLEVFDAKVVWRWETGEYVPRREQMVRIWLLTEGRVAPNSFYDLPPITGSSPLAHERDCEAA